MYNYNDVAIFIKVAQHLSFVTASERLGMPRSTVSRRIARLEEALNTRLLERNTRTVQLTEAGREFARRCSPLMSHLEEEQVAMHMRDGQPRGLIRLSASVTFGSRVLSPWLMSFMEEYPEISLELILSNENLDLPGENIDLTFRLGPLVDSNLQAVCLWEAPYAVCVAPGYVALHGLPQTPMDLSGHNCIISLPSPADRWTFQDPQDGRIFQVKVSGRLRVNDLVVAVLAVRRSMGIAYLPSMGVASRLATGGLLELFPEWQPPVRRFYAVYPSKRLVSPAVKLLIDFVRKQTQVLPNWDSFVN